VRKLLRAGKMHKRISKLKKHYIVCGSGRMGYEAVRELQNENIGLVVIENDPDIVQKLEDEGIAIVRGDATDDKVLKEAGVEHAKGLLAVLPNDAHNVYVSLSARGINPNLFIIARGTDDVAEDKLLKAGADRVISPYQIGGRSLANAAMRPHVLDFIDLVTSKKDLELGLEEVSVIAGSPLVGKTIAGSRVRERYGTSIMACRTAERMIFNPPPDHVINEGDMLIVLGKLDSLENINRELDRGAPGNIAQS